MTSFEDLGDRMKDYEVTTKQILPRRSYTIIRVDGMAFHTLTKRYRRPFDQEFIDAMNDTAKYLCKTIMGVKFAYVQSDEISLLLTDFESVQKEAWFGNSVQKMCSGSAAKATSSFNRRFAEIELAKAAQEGKSLLEFACWYTSARDGEFDSRVYQIPQRAEVMNYFIWRQWDAMRNSLSAVAHSLYSQKELHGKNGSEQHEMLYAKGVNWNDYPVELKRGRALRKVLDEKTMRWKWEAIAAPDFKNETLDCWIPENAIQVKADDVDN